MIEHPHSDRTLGKLNILSLMIKHQHYTALIYNKRDNRVYGLFRLCICQTKQDNFQEKENLLHLHIFIYLNRTHVSNFYPLEVVGRDSLKGAKKYHFIIKG